LVDAWFNRAMMCLAVKDTKGYRSICAQMLERFGEREDWETANLVAWTCVHLPDAVADPTQVVRLAEKAMAAKPKDYVTLNTLGVVLFRAGKLEAAIERLNQAINAFDKQGDAWDWLPLAMAHHHLGHAEEARRFMDKAGPWIQQFQEGKIQIAVPMTTWYRQ